MVDYLSVRTPLNKTMSILWPGWILAQQPFERLDQRSRLAIVSGLLVLVLVGVLLAVMVWAGGRFTRRVMRGFQSKRRQRP